MKQIQMTRLIPTAIVAGLIALLAACAEPPPPPPAPIAPPPPVVRIPPRPSPPMGAPANFVVPPAMPNGKRITINSNLSMDQTIWNLRSAYNVAALNCMKPEYAAILPGYSNFLKTYAKTLKTVNRDLDRTYRREYGSRYIHERESFQTQVYNFFALPPVLPTFCDAAVNLTQELAAVPPGQLESFAPGALARLDDIYQQFYTSFDQYRADLNEWEMRYGAGPVVAASSDANQGLSQ